MCCVSVRLELLRCQHVHVVPRCCTCAHVPHAVIWCRLCSAFLHTPKRWMRRTGKVSGSCVGSALQRVQPISKSYIAPLFFKMAQNLDLRCVLISDPSTLGAGAKTRLESRIKKFTPHCVCRPCNESEHTRKSKRRNIWIRDVFAS